MIADSLTVGCVTSCGLLLVVAGAGKAYASARRRDGGDAIRRALHVRRAHWRLVSVVAAAVECCVGAAVCAGTEPVLACAAMAALGAVFCGLLGYVRLRRVPGGCGCLGRSADRQPVTARSVVRAGLLAAAGLIGTLNPQIFHNGQWRLPFYPGLLFGLAVLAILSTGLSTGHGTGPVLRTPSCRRPLWRARAVTAAALADSGVFQSMTAALGPFGAATHRRDGCADEFLFPLVAGAGQAVLFRVLHGGAGNGLTVQARVLTDEVPVAS